MIKRINEQMNVRLTLDEANHINDLLKRDEAKAIIHKEKWDECPVCGTTLGAYRKFCGECGQRLDFENYAL